MNKKVAAMLVTAGLAGSLLAGNTVMAEELNVEFGFITGTGGLGDKNMNDASYEGLKQLEKQGAKVNVVEPDDASDYANLQTLFAQKGDQKVIFCISSEQADSLSKTALQFPDQRFVLVDSQLEGDNITSVYFRPEETGYQLGILAGLIEKDNSLEFMNDEQKIGFVGGQDNPVINTFAAGYMAGVKLVNPEAEVEITYVGSFSDPSKATELANGLYADGCDIIFACAGGSGLGVFTSAQKSNGYAFGIEQNQNSNAPDHIIASGMRNWDAVMVDVGTKAAKDELESGALTYGIKEGTLEVGFDGSNVPVSDEIKEEMNTWFEKVIFGEYELPTSLDDVDAFLEKYAG